MSESKGIVGKVADCYALHGVRPPAVVAVAFSGGADSVALLAATRKAGFECVALHCNFHLRGAESDRDEEFSRQMARRLGADFRVVHFDVEARRKATGESVEMACRSLRYEWFAQQFSQSGGRWGCVAVAHHADDNVETFFLNLMRGTGLRGLRGMPAERGIFLRPMLDIRRAAILDFLASEGLGYVVDSTNLLSEYRRNALRNDLLPSIRRVFPQLDQAVRGTMENIARDYDLLESFVDQTAEVCVDSRGRISLDQIIGHKHAATLLYRLLNRGADDPFAFATAESILRSASKSGLTFRSASGTLEYLLDRGKLIPVGGHDNGKEDMMPLPVVVDWEGMARGNAMPGMPFSCELVSPSEFRPTRDASVLWLDAGSLRSGAPLMMRRWNEGDRIRPFGMRGSRLVSDVYSDARMSVADKHAAWLLVSGDDVLWVPGLRTSCLFPVSETTVEVLKISLRSRINGNINKF